ncbi:hypothetical protein Dda_2743 [Drechslerella dactyloides]|uniref:BRCT domain-containing protein n=1 Tax=Drechslerella dactyloides TaxID=74499 RepID=A0AAD6J021_DREDA|nr:hypothetical protein Dda_2743 [Drechslerella dactyloides]
MTKSCAFERRRRRGRQLSPPEDRTTAAARKPPSPRNLELFHADDIIGRNPCSSSCRYTMDDDREGTTAAEQPLRGLILCCTSISPDLRAEITKKATEMGASWKQDLTSDATHLIVGDVNTLKYRYVAKQRPDVKPMKISFIETAHDAWVAGDRIFIEQLEVRHAFPPFSGLRLCLTNINDENERLMVQKKAEKHGATYQGDLTKQITHLIAARPEGKKYTFAKQWNIKVVSLDWFYQSLERGMALDEDYFSFDLPPEQRGVGAWVKPTAGKRKLSDREDSGKTDGRTKSDPARRKIKRAASDRLSSGSQTLWGDIMGQGKAPKPEKPSEWGSDAPLARSRSRVGSLMAESDSNTPYVNVRASMSMSDLPPEQPKKMFHDISFHVSGFTSEKENTIRDIIRGFDGNTFSGIQELFEASAKRYVIIVPDTFTQDDCPKVSDASRAVQTVTFWWLERCLHEEKFLEPDSYPLGRPMKRHGISSFDKMTISVTRFDGVDYLHYTKAIAKLGATFCEKVVKNRSLLIVNTADHSEQKDKTNAAEAWRIPMVSQDWLLECIVEGKLLPFAKYLLNTAPVDDARAETSSDALEGCAVKFDDAVKAVRCLGGLIVSSFDSEIPVTHFVTLARNARDPSEQLRQAWRAGDCLVVSDLWVKMSMKNKRRWPEHRYFVHKPGDVSATPQKVVRSSDSNSNSAVSGLLPDSENPFVIEEIEAHDADDAAVQPPMSADRRPLMQRVQSSNSSTTPTKSKIMTLKSPAKRQPSPSKHAIPPLLPADKPAVSGRHLLHSNLTEILRLAKQENKPASAPRRPPRKFQGRAPSNAGSISAENSNGNNSGSNGLSRTNSLQSNISAAGPDSGDGNNNGKESLSRASSYTVSNINMNSHALDFGESMLYDSHEDSHPRDAQAVDTDATQASQAIHYVDAEAVAERKKLFEKLSLTDDGGVMKGRKVVQSTVAAEELGGPIPVRRTRKAAR